MTQTLVTAPNRIAIAGNPVEPTTKPLETVPFRDRVFQALGEKTESCSRSNTPLVKQHGNLNPFFNAALEAFEEHRALVISPDMIWLLITQAFALHINANAEALRSRFVSHQGKEQIKVRRDHFSKGFSGNNWEDVFDEFSSAILGCISAERHALIVQEFSTTGAVDKAAFEVTLMDAMQEFFEYVVSTACGIPTFYLEGTTADWKKLREVAKGLDNDFGLEFWTPHLDTFLTEFVAASKGNADPKFWQDFINVGGGSGGPYIGGHINTLFPYVLNYSKKPVKNPYTDPSFKGGFGGGITTDDVPSGLSIAPFIWEYNATNFDMEFIAGFIGIEQEDDLALRPLIGWGVREK